MTFALLIDTSGDVYSVAVASQEKVLAFREEPKQERDILPLLVSEVLGKVQITVKDLDFVSVNIGPGSFTGLRVALAFAKGFCFASELPLITITAFEMFSTQTKEENCGIFIHSHREIYYYAHKKRLSEPVVLDFSQGAKIPDADFYLGEIPEFAKKYPHKSLRPQASFQFPAVFQKFSEGNFQETDTVVPYYIKEFVPKKRKKKIL